MSMTLIAHQVLGSTQASIVFSSIPATFTDLVLKFSCRTNRPSGFTDILAVTFNGSGTYSHRRLEGNGSSAASGTSSNIWVGQASANDATANTFGNGEIYIPNYTASTSKSVSGDGVSETNGTSGFQVISAGLWTGTDAINSITLTVQTGNSFLQHSSATLYGITKGSSGGVVVS